MITGYKDMKAGDTITYTRPAMTKTIVVGDAFVSTGNVYPHDYDIFDPAEFNMNDDVHVELVRPPFIVGQPLTKKMGEPPVGSVVTYLGNHVYVRHFNEWAKVLPEAWGGYRWEHFTPDALTLAVLGTGK